MAGRTPVPVPYAIIIKPLLMGTDEMGIFYCLQGITFRKGQVGRCLILYIHHRDSDKRIRRSFWIETNKKTNRLCRYVIRSDLSCCTLLPTGGTGEKRRDMVAFACLMYLVISFPPLSAVLLPVIYYSSPHFFPCLSSTHKSFLNVVAVMISIYLIL